MACGAKVVVSNTSSLPEVVGNIGSTVDPLDQTAINKTIYESIKMKIDLEYQEKVFDHLKKYDWESLGSAFHEIILS